MTPSAADLIRVLPEIIWCGFGVLLMLLQPYLKNRQGLTLFAMVGAAVGTLATYFGQMGSGFFGLIQFDTYSLFFHWLVGLVAFLVILASDSYLERENLAPAEFYALILFATAGMGVLASAQELLTAFIGLEMSSISSYVLAGYRRDAVKSSESAVKYFLLGSFATAFFLYGIALVYGAFLCGTKGGDVCAAAPDFHHDSCGHGFLVLGVLDSRGGHDVRWQPGRTGANQREAHAGV